MVVNHPYSNPINLPHQLTFGHTPLRHDIAKWLEEEHIVFNYSDIFSSIHFEKEEDKVKFILRWL